MKPLISPHPFGIRAVSRSGCRAGLTLVELLVAIGIIAALASLLLAAVQRTTSVGASAKCVTNLKSIGVSLMGYLSDHNGKLPAMSALADPAITTSDTLMAQKILAAYLGMPDDFNWKNNTPAASAFGVWICPADTEARQKTEGHLPRWKALNSYLLNYYTGKGAVKTNGENVNNKTVLRITEVRNPNEIWYFADGIRTDGGQGRMTDELVASAGETVGGAAIRFRHGRSLNVLTLGGSVQTFTPENVRANGTRFTTPVKN